MVNDGGYGHFWLCIILFEVPYFLSIFPLKTWERAPPIFYRKSPWDGVEYHRFFFLNLSMLVAEIATRSFGAGCIRHIFGRMKATITTWTIPETAHEKSLAPRPGVCASGHYTIFFLYQWNQLSILRGRLVALKVLMMRIKSEEDCFCQDNILKV